MTLESKLREMIQTEHVGGFTAQFFGMIHDDHSWCVNDVWSVDFDDKESLIEGLRDRWEIIKVNYGRQRVGGIEDIGFHDGEWMFEADMFPVFNVIIDRS